MGGKGPGDPRECMEKITEEHDNYHETVNVVSAFEYFFKKPYSENVTFFDRFPVIPPRKLRPDFTVLFNENYGLVGEICRSLPEDGSHFMNEIEQLKSYDAELAFKKSESETLTPTRHDIMLILSPNDSSQIIARIEEKIKKGVIKFQRDLIFMEYIPRHEDRTPNYILRKFPGFNNPFKKTSNNPDEDLENLLGTKKIPLRIPIKYLNRYTSVGLICNDIPSPAYFAVQLWFIFYDYLTQKERLIYKEGGDKKGVPIKLKLTGLIQDLNNKYIPGAKVERSWVKKALDFLSTAGYAEEKNGEYEIKYRNIVERLRLEKEAYMKNGEEEEEIFKDLSRHFILRYCERLKEEEKKIERKKGKKQAALEKYGITRK